MPTLLEAPQRHALCLQRSQTASSGFIASSLASYPDRRLAAFSYCNVMLAKQPARWRPASVNSRASESIVSFAVAFNRFMEDWVREYSNTVYFIPVAME